MLSCLTPRREERSADPPWLVVRQPILSSTADLKSWLTSVPLRLLFELVQPEPLVAKAVVPVKPVVVGHSASSPSFACVAASSSDTVVARGLMEYFGQFARLVCFVPSSL